MRIVTVEEMRAVEKAADAAGVSYAQMMENAGRAVALWIKSRGVEEQHVLVLVGPGNNGGDGLVVARYLAEAGAIVTVYVWKRDTEDDENWALLQGTAVRLLLSQDDKDEYALLREEVAQSDWIVDALLGTGISLPLKGELCAILDVVRAGSGLRKMQPVDGLVPLQPASLGLVEEGPIIVAVDVPTGLDSDTGALDPAALLAAATITFGYPKQGLFQFPGAEAVGELVVADIGIPAQAAPSTPGPQVLTPTFIRDLLPARPSDANKGTFGRAMIVAGSVNYTGAPYLAAAGAMRVGAGLVTLGVAGSLLPVLASKISEATFVALPQDMGALVPQAARVLHEALQCYTALLIGPGLGQESRTVDFVREVLSHHGVEARTGFGFLHAETPASVAEESDLPPMVMDADALNALGKIEDWTSLIHPSTVLTPHPGEMARLLGTTVEQVQADRLGCARECATRWGCVIALKGAFTVVAAPDGALYLNPFATPALATAGTGDVLAGAITGFMAQGLTPLHAALAGVYVHALAGQIVEEEIGRAGGVAGDLLDRLPISLQIVASSR